MKPKDILMLLALAAIWGSSYLFLRLVTPSIGVSLTMASRIILAAIVMTAVFTYGRRLPDYRRLWKQYFVLGFLNILMPFAFITYSVTNLNASLGAILNATTPLFTMVISSFWLKERMNMKKVIGLITGFAGITVLLGWMPLEITGRVITSVVASLLAAISYGIGAVYTRLHVKSNEPVKTATGMISAAALLVLPLLGNASGEDLPGIDITAGVVMLGVLCTAIGYSLYMKLITNVGPTNASLVSLLVPVFSLLWGLIFLHEPVTPAVIAGLFLVMGSLRLILFPGKKTVINNNQNTSHETVIDFNHHADRPVHGQLQAYPGVQENPWIQRHGHHGYACACI
ncbi:MAG TPA: DMT family transporter [Flavisolibacter sp.]